MPEDGALRRMYWQWLLIRKERVSCLIQGSRRYLLLWGCVMSFPLPSLNRKEELFEGREMLSLMKIPLPL